jgi:type II secretory pathway component PulF
VTEQSKETQETPIQNTLVQSPAEHSQTSVVQSSETLVRRQLTAQALPTLTHPQVTSRQLQKEAAPTDTPLFKAFYGNEGANRRYTDFCDRLAALLAAGVPTAEALISAANATGPKELLQICLEIEEPVSRGVPLSQALAPYRDLLPPLFVPVLAASERWEKDTLEKAVRRLADAFREGVAAGHKVEYNGLGVTSALGLGASEWAPGRTIGARRRNPVRDWIRLRFPLAGKAGQCMAMSRWARSFSTLWNSGVSISEALDVSARSARNAHVAQALHLAAARTRQGWSLRDSLAGTRVFPPHALAVLETGEMTGEYGPELQQLVRVLEDDAKQAASQLLALMFLGPPFVVALLAAILALIYGIAHVGWH